MDGFRCAQTTAHTSVIGLPVNAPMLSLTFFKTEAKLLFLW